MAIRTAGAGNKVFFAQFVKGRHYSELNVLKDIPSIVVKQYGLIVLLFIHLQSAIFRPCGN
jgi:cob(I)alamin adenosyltransferase